jgi:hypothetical protein
MADSDSQGNGGDPGDDKKVKDLLDPATQVNLARWFGLPSFEQLADEGKQPAVPAEDPELVEVRARRAAAIAAVDRRLLAEVDRRTTPARPMATFTERIDVRVDPSFGFDLKINGRQLAEPRDYERPQDISDELRHATPQALLRDLHRAEMTFQLQLEWFDPLPEDRLAARAVATETMATRWSLPHRPPISPFLEAHELLREGHRLRRRPWTEIEMPRRQVTE